MIEKTYNKPPKYKVGDRFIFTVSKLLPIRNWHGKCTDYILNADKEIDEKICPSDGIVVQEEFLNSCAAFGLINETNMVNTDKMLPCPFCGCHMDLLKEFMLDGRTIRYVPYGKHKYGCQLQFCSSAFVGNPTTKNGAIRKWNRRTI